MKLNLTSAAALPILSVVALLGTFVLLALGKPVDGLIQTIDTVTLSAVAGAAVPTRQDHTPPPAPVAPVGTV